MEFDNAVIQSNDRFFNKTQSHFGDLNGLSQEPKVVTSYASYLYDSVIIFAKALANIGNNTKEKMSIMSENGTFLADTIKNMKQYQSIRGENIAFDAKGNSEGKGEFSSMQ